MTFEEARAALMRAETVPAAALAAAVEHAAALAPEVIALLEAAAAGQPLLLAEERLIRYGLTVLAAARRTEAFPALCALYAAPWQTRLRLFGDAPHAGEAPLATSLFNGDAEPLYALLEAPEPEVDVQCAAFAALAWLVREGRETPERLLAALDRFEAANPEENDDGWIGWRDAVLALHLTDRAERQAARWGIAWPPEPGETDSEDLSALAHEDPGLDDAGPDGDDPEADEPFNAELDDLGLDDLGLDDLDDGDFVPDEKERRGWLLRALDPPAPEDLAPMAPIDEPAAACMTEETDLPPADPSGLSAEELNWLSDTMLRVAATGRGMPLESTDGYFTACLATGHPPDLAPQPEAIWDPDAAAETLGRPELLRAVHDLLARHYRAIARRLERREPVMPFFDRIGHFTAGALWSQGFLLAVQRRPAEWAALLRNPRTAKLLEPMRELAAAIDDLSDDDPDPPDDQISEFLVQRMKAIMVRAGLIKRIPALVTELRQRGPGMPSAAAPKTGRNDPCPCGSGRKYKKCCGAAGVLAAG